MDYPNFWSINRAGNINVLQVHTVLPFFSSSFFFVHKILCIEHYYFARFGIGRWTQSEVGQQSHITNPRSLEHASVINYSFCYRE